MVVYRYKGWGTTDSNGVAKLEYDENDDPLTHSYTGVGAGEVDFIASTDGPSAIGDGSFQSETFVITDCIVYDRASSSEKNTAIWNNYNSLFDVSYTSDYTDLKENGSDNGRYNLINPSSQTLAYLNIPFGTRIEVDIKCVDGETTNTPFRIMNSSATSNISSVSLAQLNASVGEWVHCILDITNNGIVITREDGTTITRALPSGSPTSVYCALWTHGTMTEMQFKNFMMYPI